MQSDLQEANREKTLGNECFSAKNYQQAIKHFTKAIDLNPEDHVFYSNRSACYANLEEYDKALVDAQICCDLNPTWAKGYLRRGLAEFYLKKYDQAEKTYKEGLKLEPGNQQLVEGLQRVQETKKSQPEAGGFDKEKFFQEAVTQLKSNPETSAFFQDKEFVEKINEIKNDPQKAALYMNDPKIQKAFEVIKAGYGKTGGSGSGAGGSKGKPKEGTTAEEEKARGNEEFQKKNFEAAIYHYDKAIELNPSEPTYYNNKAAVYLELKNPRKVIESCNKAISLFREQGAPDKAKLAKALSRKAAAFALEQDFDEAIKYYKESLKEKDDPAIREEIKKLSQS